MKGSLPAIGAEVAAALHYGIISKVIKAAIASTPTTIKAHKRMSPDMGWLRFN